MDKPIPDALKRIQRWDIGYTEWGAAIQHRPNGAFVKLEDVVAILTAAQHPTPRPQGEVVVTRTEDGEIVAVTRQDEDGRVLSVIAESMPAANVSELRAEVERLRDKVIEAVVRYELAAQRVKSLSNGIGEALDRCPISVEANSDVTPWQTRESLSDGARVKTHLWQAYHETTDADAPYPPERRLNDWEQQEYLDEAGCPHCMEAWRLVQHRREARKSFGAAKRAIRTLGKSAIKARQALTGEVEK